TAWMAARRITATTTVISKLRVTQTREAQVPRRIDSRSVLTRSSGDSGQPRAAVVIRPARDNRPVGTSVRLSALPHSPSGEVHFGTNGAGSGRSARAGRRATELTGDARQGRGGRASTAAHACQSTAARARAVRR